MSAEINKELLKLLEIHEGYRRFAYYDSTGHLTIGIGRNLTDQGISREEAEYLLCQDVIKARQDAKNFKWYGEMSIPRQHAVLDMLFNMGLPTFLKFKHMINALEKHDYEKAAAEARNSKWAQQVKSRSEHVVDLILNEAYPPGVSDEE